MKPEAAQKPTESGYLWVKVASQTRLPEPPYWTWDVVEVSPWTPVWYDGQNDFKTLEPEDGVAWDAHNEYWESNGHVVIAWRKPTPPES